MLQPDWEEPFALLQDTEGMLHQLLDLPIPVSIADLIFKN